MNEFARLLLFLILVLKCAVGLNPLLALGQRISDQTDGIAPREEPRETGTVIDGTVLDESGQPVRQALVAARIVYRMGNLDEYLHHAFQYTEFDRNLVEGQSDADGVFRLTLSNEYWGRSLTVIAQAQGYAPTAITWKGEGKANLKLAKGTELRGTVLSLDGKPVPAANVSLLMWFNYQQNQAALGRNWKSVALEGQLAKNHIAIQATTDRNGGFVIRNVPADRWAVLAISAEGYLPKSVVADTGEDPAIECGADAHLFVDGANIRLEPATRLELIAVSEEGLQVPLKEAYSSLLSRILVSEPGEDQAKPVPVRDNRVSLPVLLPGAQRFWLVPTVESGYVGAFIDIEPEKGTETIERRVELTRGAKVIGRVVDDATNAPIEGATFHYDPEAPAELKKSGVFVPVAKSDKNGEFVLIVPTMNAHLRQIGRVNGYRSITYDLNADVRPQALSKEISPELYRETRVEFRLKSATRIKGQVVDELGAPVAHARFLFRDRTSQGGYMPRQIAADEQGQFELRNLFAETSFDPQKANRGFTANSTDEHAPFQETIYVWSPDRIRNAVLQLPFPAPGQPDIEVRVILRPAAEVKGRLIDEATGEGVSGIKVSARTEDYLMTSFLPATSDENGEFIMPGLFPDTSMTLSTTGEYIGHRGGKSVQFVTPGPSEQLELGTIPLIVYRDLEALLVPPDIQGLSPEEAFQTLLTGMKKVAERIKEIQQMQSGQSSEDSISTAGQVAAERFGEALLRLGKRSNDADFEFQVVTGYMAQVDSFSSQSFQYERAKKTLIEKFLDREELVTMLPSLVDHMDGRTWRQVFDQTTNERVKTVASEYVFRTTTLNFQSASLFRGLTDQQFQAQLEEAKRIWKTVLEQPEGKAQTAHPFRERALAQLRQTLKQLESARATDPLRLERAVQAMREFLTEYD
jgi:uncharacterized GH25 family protein